MGIKSSATTGLSYSTVRLLVDGSVLVYAGTSDMGQGARTIFAQIAANELGAPVETVSVVMGDTAVVPYDQQTSASRSTVFMGNAIMRACRDIQAQVRAHGRAPPRACPRARSWSIAGVVSLPDGDVPIVDVVEAGLGKLGGELIGNGVYRKEVEPDHPLGGSPAFYEFNCTAVEVSVDEETGHITIHKHVIVGDTGKSLNPEQVAGQDEGAAIMGLGHTLMEHIILDEYGLHPEPGCHRLPHPDLHGPAAAHGERGRRERGRPRSLRRQGRQRGRPALGPVGRRRGRGGGHRRGHPRAAPDAGTRVALPPGRTRQRRAR